MPADISQEYLEEVLKFKAKKELSEGFLETHQLEQLFKELTLQLGFDKELWTYRKEVAKSNFLQFEMLSKESKLGWKLPETYNQTLEKHLLSAIHLDPFNKEYLKKYVVQNRHTFQINEHYFNQFLKLFDPASAEYTNMQVEMGLSSSSFSFDYFDEHLMANYIDALVFINEKLHSEKTDVSKSTLEKLAQDAGLDDTLKTELNEELASMLKVLEKSADESFGSWQDIHKASLVVDRLVALAPLNPEVIYAAIYFYAYTLCNAFFDSLDVRYGKDAKSLFFKSYMNSEKPKKKQMLYAAIDAFEKAEELGRRFQSLPDSFFEETENDKDPFNRFRHIRSKHNMLNQKLNPAYVSAFLKTQKTSFELNKADFEFKIGNTKFTIIVGAILYLVFALICLTLFESFNVFLSIGFIPAMAALGIAELRNMWWKKKKLDF